MDWKKGQREKGKREKGKKAKRKKGERDNGTMGKLDKETKGQWDIRTMYVEYSV